MADNRNLAALTGNVAADEVTYSGDTTVVQLVRLVVVAGAEGSKTLSEISDATNGVDVDVTRVADTVGSGNLTAAAQAVTLSALNGANSSAVQITGTWVGTVQFEGSVDGTNYFAVNGVALTTGALVTSATANGQWQFDIAGLVSFRVRCSAYTSGTVVVSVRSSVTGCATIALDAPLPAGTNAIGQVGGITVAPSASYTRPADVIAYAAGDVVANSTSAPVVLTFANCVRANGGTGMITNALMVDSASVATKGIYELWLYHTSPGADNDNALFTPTDAELLNLVGVIPFSTAYVGDATAGAGGNCVYPSPGLNISFKCAAAATSLFGILVIRNAYTPVSAEVFTITLNISQD